MKQFTRLIVSVCAMCLLTACFDVEEQSVLRADGGVEMTLLMRLAMPQSGSAIAKLRKDAQELTKVKGQALGGVRITDAAVNYLDGALRIRVALAAQLADFQALFRSEGSPLTAFSAKLGEPGGDLPKPTTRDSYFACRARGAGQRCERKITPLTPAAKKSKTSKNAPLGELGDMTAMMTSGMFQHYSLTMPAHITASNAESVQGNTATWVFPISHLAEKSVTLWVETTP